jgi:hypothetical protein
MTAAYFALILRAYGPTAPERAVLLEGTGVPEGPLADPTEIIPGSSPPDPNASRILSRAGPVGARLQRRRMGRLRRERADGREERRG